MEKKVLVLNLDHTPVAVVTVQKAMVLTILEKVCVLADYSFLTIRTVDQEFKYPAVVRLYEYKNIPFRGVLLNRNNIFKRDNNECQYCGSQKHLTIDHVIPRSKGGGASWKNLVTACHRCNIQKGDKTPEEVGFNFRREPFRPSLSYFLSDYAEKNAEEWLPFLEIKAL
ncbi:HNH endonuclease [Echinicola jeungdonensis]|uniref:HNH endonuclease n=1 Tax=Echinicola jeungdonensis TaxID=709343 RepID=A0ABV5J8H2_9BACT|nr:HNH endonuclease [Echinicola jeungdonensis]MDN3669740.1 HNH endonuclease [Echinicola jeungdonensis]